MEEIKLNIDCYQCGKDLEFPFRLFVNHAEYCYCPDCGEGVQVYFNNNRILSIERLPEQFS